MALQANLHNPGLISTACLSLKTANTIAAAIGRGCQTTTASSRHNHVVQRMDCCAPGALAGTTDNGLSSFRASFLSATVRPVPVLGDIYLLAQAHKQKTGKDDQCRSEQLQHELEQAQPLVQE
mmetsp:Transcript_25792/g.57927  ORF Transcript_25792/g.57927 Transcript_25792/m.57927 type:complete len:123 (+) Transcript_25792:138-506(+)